MTKGCYGVEKRPVEAREKSRHETGLHGPEDARVIANSPETDAEALERLRSENDDC